MGSTDESLERRPEVPQRVRFCPPCPCALPRPPQHTQPPQDGPGGSQVRSVPAFERVGWDGWATAGRTACGKNSVKNNQLSGSPGTISPTSCSPGGM